MNSLKIKEKVARLDVFKLVEAYKKKDDANSIKFSIDFERRKAIVCIPFHALVFILDYVDRLFDYKILFDDKKKIHYS
jgi:hypothetical protein